MGVSCWDRGTVKQGWQVQQRLGARIVCGRWGPGRVRGGVGGKETDARGWQAAHRGRGQSRVAAGSGESRGRDGERATWRRTLLHQRPRAGVCMLAIALNSASLNFPALRGYAANSILLSTLVPTLAPLPVPSSRRPGVIGSQDRGCPGFAPDVELYTFKVFTDDQVCGQCERGSQYHTEEALTDCRCCSQPGSFRAAVVRLGVLLTHGFSPLSPPRACRDADVLNHGRDTIM